MKKGKNCKISKRSVIDKEVVLGDNVNQKLEKTTI